MVYSLCVACLIGLPGSGKTTFTNSLLSAARGNLLDFGVICIVFDDFIKWNSDLNNEYKKSRESLLKSIQIMIEQLSCNDSFNIDESEILNKENCLLNGFKTVLIVLDDNHYFKSMRYEVIKICRKFSVGYFQIFFQVDLPTAKIRNLNREQSLQIPNEVIERMYQKLEPPIFNSKILTIQAADASFSLVSSTVIDQINNPQIIQIEKSKVEPTVIHKIDIMLRKEISNRIKLVDRYSTNVGQLAGSLNQRRKEVLQDLRTGFLDIPNNVTDVIYFMG